MSLKQEIETWVEASDHYDDRDYEAALAAFGRIADTSKILFNCGMIYATLGEHASAIDCYQRAVQLDPYLAVAYFQQGVSNFLRRDFDEALANFNDTLLYLRGNRFIDYEQLGLKFKLHSCEALFNRGLCFINLGQRDAGMQDLIFAAREKAVPDHSVIDDAIRDHADGYTVFSIPVGIIYRANEAKVKNLRSKDYLPRARLVAQQRSQTPQPKHTRQLSAQDLSHGDRQHGSWAATNMVRPGLTSRSRQHSEPPAARSLFPPTPPPESDKPKIPNSDVLRVRTDSLSGVKQEMVERKHRRPKLETGLALRPSSHLHTEVTQSAPERIPGRNPISAELEGAFPQSTHSNRDTRSFADSNPPTTESYRTTGDGRATQTQVNRSNPHSVTEAAEREAVVDSPAESTNSASSQPSGMPVFEIVARPRQRLLLRDHDDRPSSLPRHQLQRSDSTATIAERRRAGSASRRRAESHSRTTEDRGRARGPPPQMARMRVKIHTDKEIRHLMIDADADFASAASTIRVKLGWAAHGAVKIRFRDEEGDMLTLADDEDWAMAVDKARRCMVEDWARGWHDVADVGRVDLWVSCT